MATAAFTRRRLLILATALWSGPAGAAGISDDDLHNLMSGSDDERAKAADYVMDHPDCVDPMAYIYVTMSLWQRGDRARAAFWYYVWQIRTMPWLKASKDSTYAAARSALGSVLGPLINQWIGSDFMAWKALVGRAISFEKKAPLIPKRPEGMSPADWRAAVSRERSKWAADFSKTFGRMTAEQAGATRRKSGLSVGPWDQPGRPLPAAWR